jgi:hypothetical protein
MHYAACREAVPRVGAPGAGLDVVPNSHRAGSSPPVAGSMWDACRSSTRALRARVRTAAGSPVLDSTFRSSVPGLFFVSPAAALTFGLVSGTDFAARRVAGRLLARFSTGVPLIVLRTRGSQELSTRSIRVTASRVECTSSLLSRCWEWVRTVFTDTRN